MLRSAHLLPGGIFNELNDKNNLTFCIFYGILLL